MTSRRTYCLYLIPQLALSAWHSQQVLIGVQPVHHYFAVDKGGNGSNIGQSNKTAQQQETRAIKWSDPFKSLRCGLPTDFTRLGIQFHLLITKLLVTFGSYISLVFWPFFLTSFLLCLSLAFNWCWVWWHLCFLECHIWYLQVHILHQNCLSFDNNHKWSTKA